MHVGACVHLCLQLRLHVHSFSQAEQQGPVTRLVWVKAYGCSQQQVPVVVLDPGLLDLSLQHT